MLFAEKQQGLWLSVWSICTPDMEVWKVIVCSEAGHPGLQGLEPYFSNNHLTLRKMQKIGQRFFWSYLSSLTMKKILDA